MIIIFIKLKLSLLIFISPRLNLTVFTTPIIKSCVGSFKNIRKLHWSRLIILSFVHFLGYITSKLIRTFYMNRKDFWRVCINSLFWELAMLPISIKILSAFSSFLIILLGKFWSVYFSIISYQGFNKRHA